jgi:uncharacterized protein YndB with AHSA1/START domain
MNKITVKTFIKENLEKVWHCWTQPEHIVKWNFATSAWTCPNAVNVLEPGGKFVWRMEARDGSMGFDYTGTYIQIKENKYIKKKLEDGRQVEIWFTDKNGSTEVKETFEPDGNDPDLQQQGWQAILDNFKNYAESGIPNPEQESTN